nr:MAG TPA: hypothetical protein [Bacteriophage sp.]
MFPYFYLVIQKIFLLYRIIAPFLFIKNSPIKTILIFLFQSLLLHLQ